MSGVVSDLVVKAAELQMMAARGAPPWVLELAARAKVEPDGRRMFELGMAYAQDPAELDALAAEIGAAREGE